MEMLLQKKGKQQIARLEKLDVGFFLEENFGSTFLNKIDCLMISN